MRLIPVYIICFNMTSFFETFFFLHKIKKKMGITFGKIWSRLFSNTKDYRIILLGLDGAGKTTILYRLKLGEVVHTIPTIGFNVETIACKNINLVAWDIGGQDRIRPLWRHYFVGSKAIIFVIDSSDIDRIGGSGKKDNEDETTTNTAKYELDILLKTDELKDIPLLIFANKQDLPNALSTEGIASRLNLPRDRQWFIQPCSAGTDDDGRIYEGIDWLCKTLNKQSV